MESGGVTPTNYLPITPQEPTTIDGITYTINNDGSITAQGTNTQNYTTTFEIAIEFALDNGTYVMGGMPDINDSTPSNKYYFYVKTTEGTTTKDNRYSYESYSNRKFTVANLKVSAYIRVSAKQNVDYTFYPKIYKIS